MRSTSKSSKGWLLLLYALPARQTALRVALWRRLKKIGALSLKTSAHVLPDQPVHFERFQWLAQQALDGGGEATLVRATRIEGLANDDLVHLFNEARKADYTALAAEVRKLANAGRRRPGPSFQAAVEKLRRQFQDLQAIDYFACPAAHDVEVLLSKAASRHAPATRRDAPILHRKDFQRRIWLTRPRPEIDRVGSAWLIRKFIDPHARFIFAPTAAGHPRAIPFDMLEVEFTHHGDDCTFETLLKRFAITDRVARRIGEMIHDADLEDAKFQRAECVGLDLLCKGWARLKWTDAKIVQAGQRAFDALYASLG
ncbi:hypothetical protein AYO41_02380 [Verrucomicrobia bacterium SCGC AG-212-E04]|nr:hypothetical protein AYO41_02380 [Verrucomicrobia bacterium SCGC AG-212-E04]